MFDVRYAAALAAASLAKRVERDVWAVAYAQQRQQQKVLDEPSSKRF